MPITYTVAIDYADDGDFSDAGEDITADVISLAWRLGMAAPYDSVAAPSEAHITVRSPARDYSPEVASDDLNPGKPIRIQSNDGVTTRTHFTGFIRRVEPLPGSQGERTAVIHAHGPERELRDFSLRLPPQLNVTADPVIAAVLDAVPLRRTTLTGYWLLDVTGHAELGSNTRLAVQTIARSLEVGKSTLAYVGDTWGEGVPAAEAIRQVVEAERGRFFINRDGQAVFYNRHHTLLDTASDATFDDDMDALDYAYGAEVISGVQVRVTPRSIGASGSTLWTLESPQKLDPHGSRQLVARFRDADKRPIGALTVIAPKAGTDYAANVQPDGSGSDLTAKITVRLMAADASAATLEIANPTGVAVYLLAGARVRGTPIFQGDPLVVEQTDYASQTFHGPRARVYDLPALTSLDEAADVAGFELTRRKDPRGLVRSIQVNAAAHLTQSLARTLFDRITVRETQTGHDADYFIVAEEHRVDLGAARHTVTWLLESAGYSAFFTVGADKVDGPAPLAY